MSDDVDVLERFARDMGYTKDPVVDLVVAALEPETEEVSDWTRDDSEGYPQYFPNPATGKQSWIKRAYIQPGGCVELDFYGEEGSVHLCDFQRTLEQMNNLLECWTNHPERYD